MSEIYLQILLVLSTLLYEVQWNPKSEIFTIPLGQYISNNKEIGLKDIVEDIEYVQLEYKPECALARIVGIYANKQYFFIDSNSCIYQFLRSGKFVRQIGKQGRGPGEFTTLLAFDVDDAAQKVYVLPAYAHQILVYNFNGEFSGSIPLEPNTYSSGLDVLESEILILNCGMNMDSKVSLKGVDKNGKSIFNFCSENFRKSNTFTGKAPNLTYWFNNQLFVKEVRHDTVYQITNHGVVPKYVFNLGKFNPLNFSASDLEKSIEIYKIFETDKYIFTFFTYRKSVSVSRFEKVSNEVIIYSPEAGQKKGIINDFDNGPAFYTTLVPRISRTDSKEWILPLAPNSILKFKNDPKITGNFKKLVDKFEINNNPAIMVIKLK
jgi:hypothetical protein